MFQAKSSKSQSWACISRKPLQSSFLCTVSKLSWSSTFDLCVFALFWRTLILETLTCIYFLSLPETHIELAVIAPHDMCALHWLPFYATDQGGQGLQIIVAFSLLWRNFSQNSTLLFLCLPFSIPARVLFGYGRPQAADYFRISPRFMLAAAKLIFLNFCLLLLKSPKVKKTVRRTIIKQSSATLEHALRRVVLTKTFLCGLTSALRY